jgi:hypothetical protein
MLLGVSYLKLRLLRDDAQDLLDFRIDQHDLALDPPNFEPPRLWHQLCDGFRHRRERDRRRHGRPDSGAKAGRLRIVLLRLGDTFLDCLFLRGRKFDAPRCGAVRCRVLGKAYIAGEH